ncbi:MAG: MBL fold metallo-hydrolase [Parvibaculaceae bacterium]
MSFSLTILGCGSSAGVPRIGNHWGACDPENPRNRRRRCSVLLERTSAEGATRVLIDTSPDLRDQLLDAGVGTLDGVLFSHEHADHTHGIDELRAIAINMRRLVQVWADQRTEAMLMTRFGYCFRQPEGSDYPPILLLHPMQSMRTVGIGGAGGEIAATPFDLRHGLIEALGFRIGGVAYTPDLNGIPDRSRQFLEGLDLWIVDALRPSPHPSHFSLEDALGWIERLKPRRAILTNMHIDMDYETLRRSLPENVAPAYDGMTIDLDNPLQSVAGAQ